MQSSIQNKQYPSQNMLDLQEFYLNSTKPNPDLCKNLANWLNHEEGAKITHPDVASFNFLSLLTATSSSHSSSPATLQPKSQETKNALV